MSRLKQEDFYYGSVLSKILNNPNERVNFALISGNKDRRIYDLEICGKPFQLFIKYRTNKITTKHDNYSTWEFNITKNDRKEIRSCMHNMSSPLLAFLCGLPSFLGSEIALLTKADMGKIDIVNKSSITISRKKNEHEFSIYMDRNKDNLFKIRTERFHELFGKDP
ncbi:hypothetical protein NL50_00165 [Clostridium acetobutylicum]|nr:hypothetical protein NL50_00165 [Clostridium acetobutylicum]